MRTSAAHKNGSTPLTMTGIACFIVLQTDHLSVTLSEVEGRHAPLTMTLFLEYFNKRFTIRQAIPTVHPFAVEGHGDVAEAVDGNCAAAAA